MAVQAYSTAAYLAPTNIFARLGYARSLKLCRQYRQSLDEFASVWPKLQEQGIGQLVREELADTAAQFVAGHIRAGNMRQAVAEWSFFLKQFPQVPDIPLDGAVIEELLGQGGGDKENTVPGVAFQLVTGLLLQRQNLLCALSIESRFRLLMASFPAPKEELLSAFLAVEDASGKAERHLVNAVIFHYLRDEEKYLHALCLYLRGIDYDVDRETAAVSRFREFDRDARLAACLEFARQLTTVAKKLEVRLCETSHGEPAVDNVALYRCLTCLEPESELYWARLGDLLSQRSEPTDDDVVEQRAAFHKAQKLSDRNPVPIRYVPVNQNLEYLCDGFRERFYKPQHDWGDGRLLVLYHIPLTGGISWSNAVNLIKPEKKCFLAYDKTSFDSGRKYHECEMLFRNELGCAAYDSINIHHAFPIHRLVQQPASYTTLVRNPVKRAVGSYYWQRKIVASGQYHPASDEILAMDGSILSLREYITSRGEKAPLLDQLKYFLAVDMKPEKPDDSEHYRLGALENCNLLSAESIRRKCEAVIDRHFGFVGITEYFDVSLLIFSALYGRNRIPLWRPGPSSFSPALDDLDPRIVREFEKHYAIEMEFYEATKANFEERCGDLIRVFNEKIVSLRALAPEKGGHQQKVEKIGDRKFDYWKK